jgi:hypothetical protein
MEQKAIYIGNGKKQKDNWLKSSLCLSDIPKEHTFEYNGKTYVKVNINVKDQADQYGKDVSITVDTWKPDAQPIEGISKEEKDDDGLPF